jgi:hypothetical protein
MLPLDRLDCAAFPCVRTFSISCPGSMFNSSDVGAACDVKCSTTEPIQQTVQKRSVVALHVIHCATHASVALAEA